MKTTRKTDQAQEIIKLQLKKPKNWNWELSTSKSSPHITLPIIQLYDSKGKLLIETHDNGTQRRSWHSSSDDKHTTSTKLLREERHLERCKSDILEVHKKQPVGKYESINRMRNARNINTQVRDKSINRCELSEKSNEILLNRTSTSRKRRTRRKSENEIKESATQNTNGLSKSKSDIFFGELSSSFR